MHFQLSVAHKRGGIVFSTKRIPLCSHVDECRMTCGLAVLKRINRREAGGGRAVTEKQEFIDHWNILCPDDGLINQSI